MTVGVETVVGAEVRKMVKVTGMRPEKGVEAKVVKETLAVVKALEMMEPSWVEESTVEANKMMPLEVTRVEVEVEMTMMLLAQVVLVRKLPAEAVLERMVPAQVEMMPVKKTVQE